MLAMLHIQSTPLVLEAKTIPASTTIRRSPLTANYQRSKGELRIETTPTKVHIDQYETRASMGIISPTRAVEQYAQDGKAAALESIVNNVEKGNRIVREFAKGDPIKAMAQEKLTETKSFVLGFAPTVPPQITVEEGSISIDYTMDKLDFGWNINVKPQIDYTPGKVEFNITQQPQLTIEYMGGPLYAPISADPAYVPPMPLNAQA